MAATADFTLQFICTFQRIGTGSRAKTTSVRMATLELKKAANLRFADGMHFPTTEESQVKARGWHWKKTVTARVSQGASHIASKTRVCSQMFPVADRTVKMVVPMTKYLNRFDGVRRSRKRPTLTLVRQRAIRHKGWVAKLRWSPFVTFSGGWMYWMCRPPPIWTSGMMIIISANMMACSGSQQSSLASCGTYYARVRARSTTKLRVLTKTQTYHGTNDGPVVGTDVLDHPRPHPDAQRHHNHGKSHQRATDGEDLRPPVLVGSRLGCGVGHVDGRMLLDAPQWNRCVDKD